MAFVLAGGVVGKVCEMAIQQAANQVIIVRNFGEDFQGLRDQMDQINCFLNEADEKRTGQKESVKKWLHRVRDIAWEAEDILEECAVDSMYATNTQSCTLSCNQLIYRHQMGRRIQKVKAKMSSVVEEGSKLEIVPAATPRREEEAESSTTQGWSVQDSKPVGIQSKIESMVNLLENPEIPIIAVVGMGGIGKTYLLRHVYNSRKERYEKSAWLSVSHFYSISKLQRDLAFQLDQDLCKNINVSGVSEVVAEETIRSFIQGKRCLISR
ncbi:hypothetical protein SUGI_1115590 [Cryptomeria japonica]|uniref:putative disease resistance protein RGA4 n=1 Tax=Cryptomeria japonica TaxID=3369 RepID=UPI0024146A44|nr:putative disease resistance protein RGA4 [Cryptomeria japonica]GLJ52451.1 hypothetical protein SUGI_1115590 [Cryptomeria japonica]